MLLWVFSHGTLNECVCAEWTVYCDLDGAGELKLYDAEHHVTLSSSGTAEVAVVICDASVNWHM